MPSITFWIINKIITAHLFSTITFLLIRLIYKEADKKANNFLNKANFIILLIVIFNLVLFGLEKIQCYTLSYKAIQSHPVDILALYPRVCFTYIDGMFLGIYLFHTLFLLKRRRTKVSLTLISILLLTLIYNYEKVIIYLTIFYRDYIPSSWSTYYDNTTVIWTLAFTAIYFALCWADISKFYNKNSMGL